MAIKGVLKGALEIRDSLRAWGGGTSWDPVIGFSEPKPFRFKPFFKYLELQLNLGPPCGTGYIRPWQIDPFSSSLFTPLGVLYVMILGIH